MMEIQLYYIHEILNQYAWPFIRIAALFTILPLFGSKIVPPSARIGIAVVVTIVIAPLIKELPNVNILSIDGVLIIISQLIIGFALGFFIRLIFSALETGGHVIAQTMGLGFAQMNDPANGITVPVVSQIYTIVATLIFLLIDGHLLMIKIIAESFTLMPISVSGISRAGVWYLVEWSSWIFTGAVIIALPSVGALLVINLAFGVMMRAAPQLNIFTIGFPISLMLGLLFIMLTLPVFSSQFNTLFENGIEAINQVLNI